VSLLVAVRWGPLVDLDARWVRSAHDATADHGWLEDATRQITQLGDPLVLWLVAAAAAIAVATRRQWELAALIIVVRVGEVAINSFIKWVIDRPRPHFVDPIIDVSGSAFPSGHAAGAAAMWGLLAVLVVQRAHGWTRVAVLTGGAVVIAAIAATRVFLGVHYPSDVLGGVLVGVAWLATCVYLLPGARLAVSARPAS
jgi:undecaprenyl-diphosphatase